jgi:transcriptional regulator with XRE-family HTH domain
MKTDDEKIGARVKEARTEAGLNQEVLANYLGLRVMAISKKESGAIVITAPQIAKIAKALGKPVTFFLQDVLK